MGNNVTLKSTKRELNESIKNMPIEELGRFGISETHFDTFRRLGIHTLGELLQVNTERLYKFTKGQYGFYFWNIRKSIMEMGLLFDDDRRNYEIAGISDELALVPISSLDLPTAVKNTLTRRGRIYFFGDLLITDYNDIIKIRNFGDKGIITLKNYLHSLGFKLRNERLTFTEEADDCRKKGIPLLQDALELDTRVVNILYKNGIYTEEDLLRYGPKVFELLGLGPVKQKIIEDAMRKKGLSFGTTVEIPIQKDDTPSYEEEIKKLEYENEQAKLRILEKEQQKAKYNRLIAERKELLAKEQELDFDLARQAEILNFDLTSEEESGHGQRH